MRPIIERTETPPRIYRYDPTQEGARRWLGELEVIIMDVLWTEDRPLTVEAITRRIDDRAYATIATTLNRLTEKGMLIRTIGSGRGLGAYRYQARETHDAFTARQIDAIMRSV